MFSTRNLGQFPPDRTKPCREEEPEYCTVGGWGWPAAKDWHSPGSVSSTESLERPHHTELPKQLLCLWERWEREYLAKEWITKDNHRFTRGAGMDHQGHRAQCLKIGVFITTLPPSQPPKKLTCQKGKVSLLPSRGSICNLTKDLLPTHQIFTLTPVWIATCA